MHVIAYDPFLSLERTVDLGIEKIEPTVAKERGIVIDEVTCTAQGDFESLITLAVATEGQERSLSGTVFHDGKPRIVSIKDIKTDAEFSPTVIYVSNEDKLGFHRALRKPCLAM
jgi:hypothetical protein